MKIHCWGEINSYLHLPKDLETSLMCWVFLPYFFVLYLCFLKKKIVLGYNAFY